MAITARLTFGRDTPIIEGFGGLPAKDNRETLNYLRGSILSRVSSQSCRATCVRHGWIDQ
jgi:hypothetical protein